MNKKFYCLSVMDWTEEEVQKGQTALDALSELDQEKAAFAMQLLQWKLFQVDHDNLPEGVLSLNYFYNKAKADIDDDIPF